MTDDVLCSLAIVVHTRLDNVPAILRFIEDQGDRIIFQTTAPKGEKLFIRRQDPQEAIERAAQEGRAP